jgi:hypothetical protein
MATVITDCNTAAIGWGVIDTDTDNVPSYWVGVKGGEIPNPEKPLPYEKEIRLVNSGALMTQSLNETNSALYQEIISYEAYGNIGLTKYSRAKGADPELPLTEWSKWRKI